MYSDTGIYGSRKASVVRLPKKFIKSQVPSSEMEFIAVEKQVSIVRGSLHIHFILNA